MNELTKSEKTTSIIVGANNLKNENEKIDFFDKVISCENNVSSILNTRVRIKCAYIDKQRLEKEHGFEIVNRIVFGFEDGTACITFSEGIFIAFKRLVSIFGEPPYNFDIIFKSIEKGKTRVYTIEILKGD